MQDLTINNLPTTTEEDEAMQDLTRQQAIAHHETVKQIEEILHTRHAPEPQPILCESTQTPDLSTIINTICAQLQLLSTIISQPKAQPEGAQESQSLQQCVALTLQQADWFKSMVRETIVDEVSLEDVVKDIVKDEVESAVDSYFRNEFDPTYHFDFGDAVSSEVSDQLDDVVRDRLDEVVQEQLEEVVAEKLKSIRVVFD
jgi:hypothetical protein